MNQNALLTIGLFRKDTTEESICRISCCWCSNLWDGEDFGAIRDADGVRCFRKGLYRLLQKFEVAVYKDLDTPFSLANDLVYLLFSFCYPTRFTLPRWQDVDDCLFGIKSIILGGHAAVTEMNDAVVCFGVACSNIINAALTI